MKHAIATFGTLLAASLGMAAPGNALAETTRQNATGMCQGALPAFDTQIRKRPLAVRNEGTQGAFVSCSLAGIDGEVHRSVEIVFTNSTAATAQINCTVVSGRTLGPAPQYYTRTVSAPAGLFAGIVHYFDTAVDPANMINVSCQLPPGTSLDYIRYDSVDPV